MAASRCFVQLSHPQWEHEPDPGPEKPWHQQKYGHRRKFLLLQGQWIEENGHRRAGQLHAWGEWEAESELVATLNRPDGDSPYPRWLWRPFYVPKASYDGLHNTDPFIFGPRFLYSNCFQPSRPGLRQLDETMQGSYWGRSPSCLSGAARCRRFAARSSGRLRRQPARGPAHPVDGASTAGETPPCTSRSRARRRSPAS